MYRLGWPLAKYLSWLAIPLSIKVEVIHDDEANVYVATSQDIKGLVVEAETFEELKQEIYLLIPELLSLNKIEIKATADISFIEHLSLA